MTEILPVLALLLIAVTMGLSLAHAFEYPGKRRLDREAYLTVQTIYYPGFSIGGLVGEAGGLLVTLVALLATPFGSARFWWTAAAFALLIMTQAVYWLVTHPVNNFWLKDTEVSDAGGLFFSLFSTAETDWEKLRDTWEYSHMARAFLAMASLVCMTIALLR